MTRIKPWHIAQLKADKQIPLSDHTSKSRLIWALVNNVLSGQEEFIIKIPHWRTYVVYKGYQKIKETEGGTIERKD